MSTEKKPVAFRLPEDTREELEAYTERRDISKSDAGRRLLEEGLEAETGGTTTTKRSSHPGLFGEAAASFAGSATLVAVLATVLWVVSPGLLKVEVVFWFWMVAGVSNALTVVAARRGWFGGGRSSGGDGT